jgi:DNA-binding transcriptional LysR family regulator
MFRCKKESGAVMLPFSRFTRYFAEVARLGSIRRAAETLNISASAIDRQILRAEADLDMPLFERLPTGLRLTAAGELLLAGTESWRKDFDRVRSQMEDLRGLRRGHVAIAVIDALSKGFVPDIVRRIREEFPGVSFTIKVLDNVDVTGSVIGAEVDFGILLNPQSSRDLMVRAHLDIALGFVTLPGHPLTEAPTQRFSACEPYAIVAPADPLALCQQIRILESATEIVPRVSAASDNIQMIKSLVLDGVGVGILTSLDVVTEVASGQLVFTPIADPVLKPLTLALCVVPSRQLSSAANLVLARLETRFAELA